MVQNQGWSTENPAAKVKSPHITEKRIDVLSPKQLEPLQETASPYSNGICRAAIGLMLYAGIRPHEVTRLHWEHIDLEDVHITILPQHSKTGDAGLATIHPPPAPHAKLLQRNRAYMPTPMVKTLEIAEEALH